MRIPRVHYLEADIFPAESPEGKTASKKYSIFRRKFQYKTPGGCEKPEK